MSAEFARHAPYIIASYAATVLILGALVVRSILAYRAAKARLKADGDDA